MVGIILIVLIQAALTMHGVDIQQLTSAANLICLKEQYDVLFLVLRGYRPLGNPDPNLPALLKAAHQANITNIHISMYPCRSRDAEYQANQLINSLNTTYYEMIWISMETNSYPECGWEVSSHESNCRYLEAIVAEIKKREKKVGIFSNRYLWASIFGSETACAKFTDIPLWYPKYNSKDTFTDF